MISVLVVQQMNDHKSKETSQSSNKIKRNDEMLVFALNIESIIQRGFFYSFV